MQEAAYGATLLLLLMLDGARKGIITLIMKSPKYIPPQLTVVVFATEKGYAASSAELAKKREERLIRKQEKRDSLVEKFPNPTMIIEYNWDKYVIIDETAARIMLNENIYSFKDILDFSLSDNQTVVQHHTSGTAKTKTSTGSMIGRAVVGGVLTGGIGAVVGAATAKKTTDVSPGKTWSTTKHDYCINITINSLSTPNEILYFHSDDESANKVASILTVIVHRNESNNNEVSAEQLKEIEAPLMIDMGVSNSEIVNTRQK